MKLAPPHGRINGPIAIVIAAVLGVLGIILGAFLQPLGQKAFPPSAPTSTLPQPSSSPNTQSAGCAVLGDQQICWGQIPILPAGNDTHVRSFSFAFAKQFRAVPAVTTGINVASSGYVFAVYNASVTETGYAGSLVEILSRKTDSPVSMSYTAIGPPK